MPEQQKIDETVESTKRLDKKKISKIEQSATSLEKVPHDETTEAGFDDDDASSILDTQDEEVKEQSNQ